MKIQYVRIKMVRENIGEYAVKDFNVSSPQCVVDLFNDVFELESEPVEHLCAIFLNKKVLGMDVLSSGTINSSLLSPREIIQKALLVNAVDIVITHNHPSGDTTPSRDDIDATKRLNEACKLMGLRLLDHIIIGDGRYTSLKEQGLL